jgi:uncharacterized membrane protein YfcA
MDLGIAALLFVAGVAGGTANAIAGGATLVTFPAMMAAGLPPIVANASNALAVLPGALVAAFADRSRLPRADRALWAVLGSALAGGAAGAVLLMLTPERAFALMVPALIGIATLIFAFGKRIQAAVKGLASGSPRLRLGLVFPATVYGGYFGAGLGVMLLAVLSITGREDIRSANALKNLCSTVANFTAVVVFVVRGLISWPETGVMLAGAVAGGYAGGKLIAVLPPQAVRTAIIAIGTTVTVIYAWRMWM